jgi:rod shape-determining protein MreD
MIQEILKNGFRFIIFILLQVTIIKHLEIGRFINPFIYVIFIIMLPIETGKTLVMLLAFLAGLTVDIFYNTPGINIAACVFTAYCRPFVLNVLSQRSEFETTASPTLQSMGLNWMVGYAGTLIVLHHTLLFFLEMFSLSSFFNTVLKIILSSAATLILVVLSQSFIHRRRV